MFNHISDWSGAIGQDDDEYYEGLWFISVLNALEKLYETL
jgi:hypothetical protein